MVDTRDLKSRAHRAYGFESRLRYHTHASEDTLLERLFNFAFKFAVGYVLGEEIMFWVALANVGVIWVETTDITSMILLSDSLRG